MTRKTLGFIFAFLLFSTCAFALTAVEGTIEKIDTKAKTILVKATDGTQHTFHMAEQTTVHGGQVVGAATKESLDRHRGGGHPPTPATPPFYYPQVSWVSRQVPAFR